MQRKILLGPSSGAVVKKRIDTAMADLHRVFRWKGKDLSI